jgi:2-iminoacetate synthase
MDELREEVRILSDMGHKRIALEAGEDPINCSIEYILECIKVIYDTGLIRRINVNIAATSVEDYKKLKEANIGTYLLFQETYNQETYEKFHVNGKKRDFDYHSTAFDRAMEAGLDDVGGGVLFGLHHDWRFEVMELYNHNAYLEDKYGVGFHTVSLPRLQSAEGVNKSDFHIIDDETFLRIVALIRVIMPYAGLIISTRETPEMRKKLINLGVTQISGGSAVEVGGYSKRLGEGSQFNLSDNRQLDEIAKWLIDEDLIPSFCTACYRKDRVGDRFMSIAKSGGVKDICLPNALLTLKEYAIEYGDDDFTQKVDALIKRKMNGSVTVTEGLELLLNGEKDVYI